MKVQLWLKSETDQARLFWLGNPGQSPVPGQAWIPRSVCSSILKYPYEVGQTWRRCEVEIADWWLAKNPLIAQPQPQTELGL